jgi:hypothetical protein
MLVRRDMALSLLLGNRRGVSKKAHSLEVLPARLLNCELYLPSLEINTETIKFRLRVSENINMSSLMAGTLCDEGRTLDTCVRIQNNFDVRYMRVKWSLLLSGNISVLVEATCCGKTFFQNVHSSLLIM